MKDKIEDKVRLGHILLAIDEVVGYTTGVTLEEFVESSLIFNASVRQVAVIGEACSKLSEALKKQYPQIPWRQIIGMRNIIVHDYFGVSVQFIWSTIENDLPTLKIQIEAILQQHD